MSSCEICDAFRAQPETQGDTRSAGTEQEAHEMTRPRDTKKSSSLRGYYVRLGKMSPEELETYRQEKRERQVVIRKMAKHTRAAIEQMAEVRRELGINPIRPRSPGYYLADDRDESPGAYFWDWNWE